ncbi:helix-turn-helix psq domain [Holotrichia oblita]|uniref:Helix-turn-helix psq domain n=1 Tax=Holotrichia oblita TaxID=644536 RepID=A0ACB9THP8_HOLOL|nr:helix-turn-helix psq domain [Holotrichia oblita]
MLEAMDAINERKMGLKKTSKVFQVPRSSLQRFLRKTNSDAQKVIQTQLGRKLALGRELEEQLVEYILSMEALYYGFTRKDISKMAFTLAMRNGISHAFRMD